MQREKNTLAVVLKKKTFREADELITLYTEHYGKIRIIAPSVKKSTSRLQHAVQQLCLVSVRLALGKGGMYKLTGAQLASVFSSMRSDPNLVSAAVHMAEIYLLATPDEEPSPKLFSILKNFLEILNTGNVAIPVLLVKIKHQLLVELGFGLALNIQDAEKEVLGFSLRGGGFVLAGSFQDAEIVTQNQYQLFMKIISTPLEGLWNITQDAAELNDLLSKFFSYQLERELKTQNIFINY